jgi:RHS repeat-associated protein
MRNHQSRRARINFEALEQRLALSAMLEGFDATVLPSNDDGSTGAIDLGFSVNFLGTVYNQVYVNNNGNVTFGNASSQYTPTALTNSNQTPRIAAFFSDVDTRGSNPLTYGQGMVDGHEAFGVTWNGVGYYSGHSDKLNKFQIVLISREDRGSDDFDIELNYDQIQWETGDSSGGSGGLGGTSARLGYTNGTGRAGTYFELSGSTGAFLDSRQSTGLIHNSFNSDVQGRYVFLVHEGAVVSSPLPFNLSVSGAVNDANPSNDWGFYGRSGQSITVTLHTGSASAQPQPLSPALNYAQVEIVNQAGNVLASAANTDAGTDVSIAGFTLPADDQYTFRVTAGPDHASSTGNYVILAGDATVHHYQLVPNQVMHGQLYSAFSVDRWSFNAVAGQPVQFNLVGAGSPGLEFDLIGPNNTTLFSGLTASSGLITLPETGAYVLTVHSADDQAGAYSFSLNQVAQTELTLNTPYDGSIVASGQIQLFNVVVPTASPLLIRLDDFTNSDSNEVYLRRGAAPTLGTYDYRYAQTGADQDVQVPLAAPGTWYILVSTRLAPAESTFTLLAQASPLFVNSITPDHYATGEDAILTVAGSGFVPGTQIALVDASSNSVASAHSVQINSFAQATAAIDLTGVAEGTYGVRVTLPGGSAVTLPGAFEVLPAGAAHLETRLILPGVLGRHATATIYVEYANTGNASMPAPILTLQSGDPDGSDQPLLTLDQTRVVQGFWTSALPEGFSHSVQIYASGAVAGVLQPGERVRVPVYYAGLQQPWDFSDNSVEFDLKIHAAGSADPVDWAAMKDALRPTWIAADAWEGVFANLLSIVGTTWGDYVSMLNRNATYLSRLGLSVSDVTQLYQFSLQQSLGLSPTSVLAQATDASLPTPGLPLAFTRTFGNSITDRYQEGPFGRGWNAPWQISLEERADGTVIIHETPTQIRMFQPDSRYAGAYLSLGGDTGILRKVSGGAFELTETSGQVTRFRADSTLEYVQDINGNRITAGFTGGRLTTLTHSSGASLAISYNAAGLISAIQSFASASDVQGHTITYAYDPTNTFLLSSTGPSGTTTYTYDNGSTAARRYALTSVTDPSGLTQVFQYDVLGRLIRTSLAGDIQPITYTYDLGKVTATDAMGMSEKTFYDHRGLVLRSEDGLGNYLNYSYNGLLQLIHVTDSLGRSVSYTRCSCGRPLSITDAAGNTTRTTLGGPNNDATASTDANGNVTRFGYDANGNQTSTTYADGSVERAVYDATGQASSFVNRRGQTISLTRNAAGQVTLESFPDGTSNQYTYDVRGRLATATDTHGVTTFTYDDADRLIGVAYPNSRTLQFFYDVAGRRTRLLESSGVDIRYTYDTAGRLAELTDASQATPVRLDLYTYDAAGRLTREDKGNGTFSLYTYDAAGRIASIANHAPGGGVNSSFAYTYDSAGRRTSMTTLDGVWSFDYDLTSQLTHAVFVSTNPSIPDQDLAYSYDAVGNRLLTIINGVTTDYDSNNLNQITSAGGLTYSYDADGNLASQTGPTGTTTYSYDAYNRLVEIVSPQGTWQYEYDAFGNRVATIANGDRTEYVLDSSGSVNILATYDSTGVLLASYALGLGLEGALTSSGTSYYDFDSLGSTVGLSGATGSYTDSYAYDPFGNSLLATGSTDNPFQYIGALGVTTESSGLDLMRARQYDPTTGRFITIDPLRLGGADVNLYRYVGNQPTLVVDPLGLRWCWYGPFGESPFVNGGPPDFVGFSAGVSEGTSVGVSGGLFTGESAGASLGLGATAGVGPTAIVGPSVEVGANAGLASVGGAGAGIGAYATAGVGVSSGATVGIGQSTGVGAGLGLGYSHGNTYGFILGWGPCPEPPSPPQPPPPPGDTGDDGSSDAVQSQDPNDLLGPAGYGPQHYLQPGTVLPYTIDFENAATASAPAQRVVVTNQLSSSLNWNTLEFTELGYGDTILAVPAGSQHFETTRSMTYHNVSFSVAIQADFDPASGLITVTFQSIDPTTQLPPDVLAGFLPPEDGTGRGQGHISYLVESRANVATGTEIRNIALIRFDANTVIATNQIDPHDPSLGTDPTKEALVTIDADGPTSAVNPLPALTTNTPFAVSWQGTDAGSGIRYYSIFVSDNGGPFVAWLANTTLTTSTYNGVDGHSYRFYSVATDNVGHIQATPAAAQAQTSLQLQSGAVTTTSVVASALASTYGQALTFTATVMGPMTPVGTVQFFVDGHAIGEAITLVDGKATSTPISTIGAGSRFISAVFTSGSPAFASSQGGLANGPLVIAPAVLTIIAGNGSIRLGDFLPEIALTYQGFVNGEDASVLSSLPTAGSTARFLSLPGTYQTSASGASASNYTIHYVDGTLNVENPVKPTVSLSREAYVASLYRDLLTREPGPAAITRWERALSSNRQFHAVLLKVWNSPEHRALEQAGVTSVDIRTAYRRAQNAYRSMEKAARALRLHPHGPRALVLAGRR